MGIEGEIWGVGEDCIGRRPVANDDVRSVR